jgi:uncharacterized protein (DUF2141 family)
MTRRSNAASKLFVALSAAIVLGPRDGRAETVSNEIRFRVTGLRNDHGVLRCALYDTPGGFLQPDPPRAAHSPARGGAAVCVFSAVPPGEYALSALHDEDADGDLDRTFFGIPTEGYAVSRDAQAHCVGRPDWDDARFEHRGGLTKLRANIRYRRSKR